MYIYLHICKINLHILYIISYLYSLCYSYFRPLLILCSLLILCTLLILHNLPFLLYYLCPPPYSYSLLPILHTLLHTIPYSVPMLRFAPLLTPSPQSFTIFHSVIPWISSRTSLESYCDHVKWMKLFAL